MLSIGTETKITEQTGMCCDAHLSSLGTVTFEKVMFRFVIVTCMPTYSYSHQIYKD